ncbi:bifunctional 4-hydroxy-2-oxoglutarate aldolase/2-dehydro-3-deoxy-phosphogluconate aldolase [Caldilinea sp.]|jgi:2-dehydro-3-deoxyphosphogluconate aldolase/(4S)-4-hydroxy-2-oxoglutarate aldolase|uniref:bifunctional 4-hydroxy-2-oxoglutarate aldolase/2-dehydro-3-deoxy-phosphogluconate aldolase n=1 Tax=Caldilinea sp. TaxID=2293560 RepID=UPI0021DF3AD2|nr:bifunctional 4-hydroxy-2-oxoglutarate aldolase/2-dehydro-3-deoxy-phosphogluconate aldolase [Caldilinea sp.]GIV70524.1 MAG: bifunctional 2-keto-4-hydroxyglutarate aldolase/2-keto-3-deoxy-6-phosphogluconate aldolase [Caldilinea sp.]
MDKQTTLTQIEELGLVAVLRGPSPELTLAMVDALVAGGVRGIEITYTTPNAEEVVATLKRKYGASIVLGMGTLTEPEQVERAQAAGAQFLVSPHCDPMLGERMVASALPAMIGALTPTEVVQAHRLGADVVKLFPGSLGGPAYLQSLRGPFPHIRMMPTGGVSLSNVAQWFQAGAVAVGVGGELCPAAWAKEGRFDAITARAKEFVAAVAAAHRS